MANEVYITEGTPVLFGSGSGEVAVFAGIEAAPQPSEVSTPASTRVARVDQIVRPVSDVANPDGWVDETGATTGPFGSLDEADGLGAQSERPGAQPERGARAAGTGRRVGAGERRAADGRRLTTTQRVESEDDGRPLPVRWRAAFLLMGETGR